MSSSNSPCAACKLLRRKCTQECVFAPYFPPDQPQKFANVHKVFGASNVAKLLNDLPAVQREDAVNSLAYEADARLRDPIYGCVGLISILQHKLKQVQMELYNAKKELSTYIGPYDATGQGTDHARGAVFNHMGVSAGMAPALGLGSFEGSYQTQQHTQNDQPHHELQATQTFLEEQQQQGLALAQPQQLDPTQQQQGLALAQPQQLDLQQQQQQQQQLPLQQHRDGSEEEE
ncbi:hypothetical protein DCAR_0310295 [Daucus carota subsp. sativus]|uniref:LOB domain-containing protein n=1 Tax=Daucus carota subsp. sativus TaxID=79200 RepID=A0AAF0WK54_DAUCS|nr:hypothetical protein DCAR_0310295 [Daucus carota subsp. sativus]